MQDKLHLLSLSHAVRGQQPAASSSLPSFELSAQRVDDRVRVGGEGGGGQRERHTGKERGTQARGGGGGGERERQAEFGIKHKLFCIHIVCAALKYFHGHRDFRWFSDGLLYFGHRPIYKPQIQNKIMRTHRQIRHTNSRERDRDRQRQTDTEIETDRQTDRHRMRDG